MAGPVTTRGAPGSERPPSTHSGASSGAHSGKRERRCVVSRAVLPQDALIRVVVGPDGVLTPDLAGRLPGRGAWVEATRAAVETAARKGLFAKSFQRSVRVPETFASQIEGLLEARCLSLVGLARRAGEVSLGFDQVRAALKASRPAYLLQARDGAAGGREKVLKLARAAYGDVPVAGCFLAADMGKVLGRGATAHVALARGAAATRFASEIGRLAGFRPLIPSSWTICDD